MKFLVKYWPQITGILTVLALIFGWCWKLAGSIESEIVREQQVEARLADAEQRLDEQDAALDAADHRLIPLETKETLREQGLMK
jgi:hypothetical protein